MSDEAHWTPGQVPSDPHFGRGRAPRMTHWLWHRSQGVEIGMTEQGTYRRCPRVGCRIWAGPYVSGMEAKRDGMDHERLVHR